MITAENRRQKTGDGLRIDDLIGRPYRVGGRGPADYDCWGLCMRMAELAGRPLPELDVPPDDDGRGRLIEQQRSGGFERLDKAEPLCLVLLRVIDDSTALKWHVGTVLPDGRHFIHTTGKLGVHICSLEQQPWKLFVEGFYSYQP